MGYGDYNRGTYSNRGVSSYRGILLQRSSRRIGTAVLRAISVEVARRSWVSGNAQWWGQRGGTVLRR
jgi:hypothetical protein